MARQQGAECINFNQEDPTEVIKELTKNSLADVVIDAVGVDAKSPSSGPAGKEAKKRKKEFEEEVEKIAPKANPQDQLWRPGDAPSQVLHSSVDLAAPCGVVSIIGVYSFASQVFPIGKAMNKNLTVVMGNCPHKKYIPRLLDLVQAGIVDPTQILSQKGSLQGVIDAYQNFDLREEGWIKVALKV